MRCLCSRGWLLRARSRCVVAAVVELAKRKSEEFENMLAGGRDGGPEALSQQVLTASLAAEADVQLLLRLWRKTKDTIKDTVAAQ